ncbi:MAG: hypothetical protein J7576_17150 [Siphonobacter aquaeclarae]|jgi:hypothetical protein|nr:hypothetical protein [Siphonobacter aquaeclarae]
MTHDFHGMLSAVGQVVRAAKACQPNYAHLLLQIQVPRLKDRFVWINSENRHLSDELDVYTRQYGSSAVEAGEIAGESLGWDEELALCERQTRSLLEACESVLRHQCLNLFPELFQHMTRRRDFVRENLRWLQNLRAA